LIPKVVPIGIISSEKTKARTMSRPGLLRQFLELAVSLVGRCRHGFLGIFNGVSGCVFRCISSFLDLFNHLRRCFFGCGRSVVSSRSFHGVSGFCCFFHSICCTFCSVSGFGSTFSRIASCSVRSTFGCFRCLFCSARRAVNGIINGFCCSVRSIANSLGSCVSRIRSCVHCRISCIAGCFNCCIYRFGCSVSSTVCRIRSSLDCTFSCAGYSVGCAFHGIAKCVSGTFAVIRTGIASGQAQCKGSGCRQSKRLFDHAYKPRLSLWACHL